MIVFLVQDTENLLGKRKTITFFKKTQFYDSFLSASTENLLGLSFFLKRSNFMIVFLVQDAENLLELSLFLKKPNFMIVFRVEIELFSNIKIWM